MPAAPKVKPAANTWGGLLGLIKLFLFNNIRNRIFFACKSGSYVSNSEASSAHAIFLNCQFSQIESFVCRAHRGHQLALPSLGARRFGHDFEYWKNEIATTCKTGIEVVRFDLS